MSPFINDILNALTGTRVSTSGKPVTPAPQQRTRNKRPQPRQHVSRHGVGLIAFNAKAYMIAKLADPHSPWLQQRAASLPKRKRLGYSTNGTAHFV